MFRFCLVVAAPAMVLVVAENALRLADYGHATDFLVKIEGQEAFTTNDTFSWRFFPPTMTRTASPCYLSPKAKGTYRVFVLGGSAALGTPDPATGLARMLKVMLEQTHPQAQFEVINAAMVAINSHVVRLIAKDCARHEPDLFVVYMGNNEVVGPYGPATIFNAYSPNLYTIRTGLAIRNWRLGQLCDRLMRMATGGAHVGRWRGMRALAGNRVSADDPRMEHVYSHFRRNLMDICRTASGSGAKVVLATVITNLRDCPPFASVHRARFAAAQANEWQRHINAGDALEKEGKHQEALSAYRLAEKRDNGHAELEFRIGRCHLALKELEEAREAFVRARDLDSLRFRCDSQLNQIVRDVTRGRTDSDTYLVDAQRASVNAGRIHGRDLLHEHVHLTFDGNFLLARQIFRKIRQILPAHIRQTAGGGNPPGRDQCANLLVLTGPDRHRAAKSMLTLMADVPFVDQLGHEADMARRKRELDEMATHVTPGALAQACTAYRNALAHRPTDLMFRINLARLEQKRSNHAAAEEQYRWLAQRTGPKVAWTLALANIRMRQGHTKQAVPLYKQVLRMNPHNYSARSGLAGALSVTGQFEKGLQMFRQVLAEEPDYATARHNLAQLLAQRGQTAEAIEQYRTWLQYEPNRPDAMVGLGDLLASQDKADEAIDQYEAALRVGASADTYR
ncbi:MAG: tetratricopeptide repeat protein, partial [Pirellulaceae bacterium]|nr:tetratricopeptide repeat protein [Pirellulaceae bacterium]